MKTILLLEDEQTLGSIYQKNFEKSGYEVIWKKLPEEIVEEAKQLSADVVIIDHGIHGHETSGLDIMPDIKKLLPKAKVIVLSNYSHVDLEKSFRNAGADSYLIKINTPPKMLVRYIETLFAKEKGTS